MPEIQPPMLSNLLVLEGKKGSRATLSKYLSLGVRGEIRAGAGDLVDCSLLSGMTVCGEDIAT